MILVIDFLISFVSTFLFRSNDFMSMVVCTRTSQLVHFCFCILNIK